MPSLREVQSEFLRGIFESGDCAIAAEIRGAGLSGEERLAIYRNNVFANLRSALQAVYPVVLRLVGEEFFNHAANGYICAYSSPSGDIHDFGAQFPEFLAKFPGAAELVYLPDTARLEWLVHEAFHEQDHRPLSLERLAKVAAEDYQKLRFKLHPACRLFFSAYPVHRIWQVNQPEYNGDDSVDLSEGAVKLLVRRQGFVIEIAPLGMAEYALLAAIADGESFSSNVERALQAEPGFDPGAFLQKHVAQETIVDFELN